MAFLESNKFQGSLLFLPSFGFFRVSCLCCISASEQLVFWLVTFSLSFLSFVTWMLICSIALTNSSALSVVIHVLVDVPVAEVVPATGNAVTSGIVSAKEDARVEGTTMETIGIIVSRAVDSSLYLDCIKFSNSFSVSFN